MLSILGSGSSLLFSFTPLLLGASTTENNSVATPLLSLLAGCSSVVTLSSSNLCREYFLKRSEDAFGCKLGVFGKLLSEFNLAIVILSNSAIPLPGSIGTLLMGVTAEGMFSLKNEYSWNTNDAMASLSGTVALIM